MLRTALAVLVAVALLSVALPPVDSARVAHADSQVRNELDRLDTAGSDLAAESDPVGPGQSGARIQRAVQMPGPSWGNAGLSRLRFPATADEGRVTWRVDGGRTHSLRPSVPLVAPPDGLVLSEGGRHRLTLSLERHHGRTVVVVSRADV